MIYRDHFFDTMERKRTAKEEKHYFPKASNQPAMVSRFQDLFENTQTHIQV
jgi:hypothetical protein